MKLRWERIGSPSGHIGIYDDEREGLDQMIAMIPAGWGGGGTKPEKLAQSIIESIECMGSEIGYGGLGL